MRTYPEVTRWNFEARWWRCRRCKSNSSWVESKSICDSSIRNKTQGKVCKLCSACQNMQIALMVLVNDGTIHCARNLRQNSEIFLRWNDENSIRKINSSINTSGPILAVKRRSKGVPFPNDTSMSKHWRLHCLTTLLARLWHKGLDFKQNTRFADSLGSKRR